VNIAEVQRYILQWQVYLSCHEVKVIYIGWQFKVCITASLIGQQNQLAFVYLELNQTQAWCLVALRTCLPVPKFCPVSDSIYSSFKWH